MALVHRLLPSISKIVPDTGAHHEQTSQDHQSQPGQPSAFELPTHLLEAVLKHLGQPSKDRRIPQAVFRACAVCKAWQAAVHRLFFQDTWQAAPAIRHPAQLFTLCPLQHSRAGHIKCYIQRRALGSGLSGRAYKFELFAGTDYADMDSKDKFMLAARQDGKQSYAIYLDRSCSSKPIARLSANMMRTCYTLIAIDCSSSSSSSLAGSTSIGSSKKAAAAAAAKGKDPCKQRLAAAAGPRCQQQQLAERCWNQQSQVTSISSLLTPLPLYAAASFSSFNSSGARYNSSSPSSISASKASRGAAGSATSRQLQPDQLQVQPGSCSCGLCQAGPSPSAACMPGAAGCIAAPAAASELLRVTYKLRVRGVMLPRRMTVALPAPIQEQEQQKKQLRQQQQQQQPSKPLGCSSQQPCRQFSLTATAARAVPAASAACSATPSLQQPSSSSSSNAAAAPPGAAAASREVEAGSDTRQARDQDRTLPQQWQSGNSSSSLPLSQQPPAAPSARSSAELDPAPSLFSTSSSVIGSSRSSSDGILPRAQQQQQQPALLHCLHNKPPHWNDALRCWCLNFRGRVRLASVKNFQLISAPGCGGLTIIPGSPPSVSQAGTAGSNNNGGGGAGGGVGANGALLLEMQQQENLLAHADGAVVLLDDGNEPLAAPAVAAAGGELQQQHGVAAGPAASAAAPGLSEGQEAGTYVVRGSAGTGGVVMQFGKVEHNVFILDYDAALVTALQGFAVALTTFGTKLLL